MHHGEQQVECVEYFKYQVLTRSYHVRKWYPKYATNSTWYFTASCDHSLLWWPTSSLLSKLILLIKFAINLIDKYGKENIRSFAGKIRVYSYHTSYRITSICRRHIKYLSSNRAIPCQNMMAQCTQFKVRDTWQQDMIIHQCIDMIWQ